MASIDRTQDRVEPITGQRRGRIGVTEMVDHCIDANLQQCVEHRAQQRSLDGDMDMPAQIAHPAEQDAIIVAAEIRELLLPGELEADADDAVVPHLLQRIEIRRRRDDGRAAQPAIAAQAADHVIIVEAREADAGNDAEMDAMCIHLR